ncbi:MAG: hypothetical protein UHG91_03405 [Succinivibrionaceae bacterium]|nr:hypothetical protein [Succinivibrionaceae bacterium]
MHTLFIEEFTVLVRERINACIWLPYWYSSLSSGGIFERNIVPQLLHS